MKITILIFILVTQLFSFNFDGFKSGDDIENIISIAKNKNIPITNKIYIVKKTFDYSLLQNYKNNSKLHYYSKLAGANAYIYLHFTKKSKKLFQIEIRWTVSDMIIISSLPKKKDVLYSIFEILINKYGKPKKVNPSNYIDIFKKSFFNKKSYIWTLNNDNIIILISDINQIKLIYLDNKYYQLDKEEQQLIKDKKHKKAVYSDFNKF